jgi:hypothetical protein
MFSSMASLSRCVYSTTVFVKTIKEGLASLKNGEMGAAVFQVGDRVRLIGTDTIQTVRQYNAETLEYQVQLGNGDDSVVWVLGIYLELVEPTKKPAIGTALPTD